MASVVLKIEFRGDLYRLRLPPGDERAFSYARLQSSARELTGLPTSTKATFTYVDRDGDSIALSKHADVTDALVSQGLNPLRITMSTQGTSGGDDSPIARQTPERSQAKRNDQDADDTHRIIKCDHDDIGKVVHFGISCMECRTSPIQGPRYIMCVSADYSLCSACYKKRSSGGRAFVHEMYACDGCDNNLPIRGPVFTSRKDTNYCLCLACFNARDEINQGQFFEMNEGFYRVVHPTLDVQSLTRVLSIRKTGGALEVVHSGISCSECRVSPILGQRFKSYEGLDDDLCLPCYNKAGKGNTLHIHRGFMCDGCGVMPIVGHSYQLLSDPNNYCLCGKCFATRDKAEQAGYVESSRGFYRLVHPAWVVNSARNSERTRQSTKSTNRGTNHAQTTQSTNYAQSIQSSNVNYSRLVYPDLDLQSLISVLSVRNLGGALQVIHSGVACDGCRMCPILGPRFKSYERLNYDLCFGCHERGGKAETVHMHGLHCNGCNTAPIVGRLYHSWRNSSWLNYRLCGKCFAGLGQADQAGFVEVHQGFYRLVHPALVPGLVANSENSHHVGYVSQSSYQAQNQSGGHNISNWVDIATTTMGIFSNLNLS